MLNASGSSADFKTKFRSYIDMDYFARFEAVNYLLGNPDCIRNHANNYYLYFTPADEKGKFTAYIIPYDYDRCLGVNYDWNPAQSMVKFGPYTKESTIDSKIDIDISDVDDIRIEFATTSGEKGSSYRYIYIVEPYLYK